MRRCSIRGRGTSSCATPVPPCGCPGTRCSPSPATTQYGVRRFGPRQVPDLASALLRPCRSGSPGQRRVPGRLGNLRYRSAAITRAPYAPPRGRRPSPRTTQPSGYAVCSTCKPYVCLVHEVAQDGHLRNRFSAWSFCACPRRTVAPAVPSDRLNRKRFYIVLLAGRRDVGVMPLVFRNRFGEQLCQDRLPLR
jgi:hypothetical protein